MGTGNCPYCYKVISDRACICPYCQSSIKPTSELSKFIWIIIEIVGFLIVAWIMISLVGEG